MTKVYRKIKPRLSNYVRVVMKGAPEEVVKKCTYKITANDERVDFYGNSYAGAKFLKDEVAPIAGFGDGLKPILYAFRDIN